MNPERRTNDYIQAGIRVIKFQPFYPVDYLNI